MNDDTRPLRLEQAAERHGLHSFCIVEQGAIVYASAAFSACYSASSGRAGAPWDELVAPADLERVRSALREAHDTGHEVGLAFTARRADGGSARVSATIARIDAYREQPLLFAIGETDAHGEMLAELRQLAFRDALTGLANRACLLDACRAMLQRCRKHGGMVALLLGDLDGFKAINDSLGHAAGDETLVRVARCMQEAVREGDVVARIGGDEFAVALPRLSGAHDAAVVAGRLIRGVAGGAMAAMPVGISIGLALWPTHGDTMDELFARADHALYRAKRAGRHRYCLADEAGPPGLARVLHFFDWGADRDLGVAAIDADHRAMAALVNAIGDELKAGRDEERLVASMNRLVAHTAAHFAREERWMDSHGYAQSAVHKAEHTRLTEDLAGLALRLDTRSMVLTMRYLQDWFCRHVDETDRPLAAAIRAAGDGDAPGAVAWSG